MKKKLWILQIIILFLLGVNIFTLLKKDSKIDKDLCYLDEEYILIEKNKINNKYTSYLYKNNQDIFVSKIYNEDNKEVTIDDLIKKDSINEYNKKINELLMLKYPKFIVDALIKDEVNKTYSIRENELIIYFDNYNINPKVDDLLYLKVNYNEIKEFLNFSVILDSEYENEDGYNYTNAKKSVAITFDDSPNVQKTTRLLESLKDNKAHATFFIVGEKASKNKDILLSMKSLGMEIGSHTYSHKNMNKMTDEEIINDYEKMNNISKELFNENINLLRPPYGAYKKKILNLTNTSFIMWSLDTNDWRYRNKDYLVKYVLNNIKDGDIILFHDSYNTSIEAVSELLPILYTEGYQVMSVSELFKIKNKDLLKNNVYRNAY